MPALKADLGPFKNLVSLIRSFSTKPVLTDHAAQASRGLINLAIAAPIPLRDGNLARSQTVFADPAKGEVLFGFNKVYAFIQDTGGKVTPKRKRKLYVPLTKRGREEHQY